MSEAEAAARNEPSGIGGWLLVLVLAMVFTLVGLGVQVVVFALGLGAAEWTAVKIAYACLWLIAQAILIDVTLRFLQMIYRKSKDFPAVFIKWTWLILILISLMSLIGMYAHDIKIDRMKFLLDTLLGVSISALWTAYMKNSRRVANTFVN